MAYRKMVAADNILMIDPAGGSTYQTVLCLTDNSFKIATAIIDAKSKCGPDSTPGVSTFEVSCSGQAAVDGSTAQQDIGELYTLAANKTTIGWQFGKAVPASKDVSWSGTAFISDLQITAPTEGPVTFTMTLGIYGTPTQTVTP